MTNLYAEYIKLQVIEEDLKEKKEQLRLKIVEDMESRGVEKEVHPMGSFTITPLKTWTYPENVIKAQDKFKALKAKSESTGEATFITKPSLRFTPVKF